MSKIVVDTSAVLAVIAEESPRAQVLAWTAGMRVVAAASLPYEVGNAVSSWLKQRRVNVQDAVEAMTLFRSMQIDLEPIDWDTAVYLSAEHSIYASDAYVLQTALHASASLVTGDRRMADVGRQMGITVLEF